MTKEIRNPNSENGSAPGNGFESFVILSGFGIRVSSFPRQSARRLPSVPLRQFSSVRHRVSPMFLSRGLFIDERFATHFDIDFFHLAGEAVADITRDSLIFCQFYFILS